MPIVLVLVKPTLFWRTVYAYLTSLKPILVMVTALPRDPSQHWRVATMYLHCSFKQGVTMTLIW